MVINMNKTLKTILIAVGVSALIIGSGLFGVYKYFVTPNRTLMLSLLNMRSDIEKSFNYISDDEKEIFEDITESGGKLELNAELEKLSYLENVPVNLTMNSDKSCTVTSINLYDKFNIDVYKDKTQLLINTPLFSSGGFSIPVAGFKNAWNSSIFKDMWTVSQTYATGDILLDFAKGNLSLKGFYSSQADNFMPLINNIEVKKDGTSKVMIEDKTKNSKRYTAHISKSDVDAFITCFTDFFAQTPYGKQKLESFASAYGISQEEAVSKIFEKLFSNTTDFDITFKICDNKIREIFVELADGRTYTVAFSGGNNVFDTVSYYKDGDVSNAVKRVKNKSHNTASDTISIAGKNVLALNTSDNGFDFKLDSDYASLTIEASGKQENDYSISFDDISININDLIVLNGSCLITEDYDENFSFNKSGEYVNLLGISQQEWEQISSSILKAL